MQKRRRRDRRAYRARLEAEIEAVMAAIPRDGVTDAAPMFQRAVDLLSKQRIEIGLPRR